MLRDLWQRREGEGYGSGMTKRHLWQGTLLTLPSPTCLR